MFRRRNSMTLALIGFAFALFIIALDQASKYWILYILDLDAGGAGSTIDVLPFFNLTMVWNRGISFGLFQAQAFWQSLILIGFSLAVSGLLCAWMMRATRKLQVFAYGAIIGGAIGNAIDRAIYGAVADFLDFSEIGFSWVFNVADMAINIGVGLLLLDLVLNSEKSK
ncbi:MAG: signal peptidase II [Maricaulis sp.]|jgi:signal peptidase II|nr:signal peptidase II [Maricaulis sp.]HAQ34358.1 signal peptidase II [Alphaproteobacteria bacterium]|tara:strand:- start:291 stop:794 length:504 start_codon:yes stop_codon:yes gene_type:complete